MLHPKNIEFKNYLTMFHNEFYKYYKNLKQFKGWYNKAYYRNTFDENGSMIKIEHPFSLMMMIYEALFRNEFYITRLCKMLLNNEIRCDDNLKNKITLFNNSYIALKEAAKRYIETHGRNNKFNEKVEIFLEQYNNLVYSYNNLKDNDSDIKDKIGDIITDFLREKELFDVLNNKKIVKALSKLNGASMRNKYLNNGEFLQYIDKISKKEYIYELYKVSQDNVPSVDRFDHGHCYGITVLLVLSILNGNDEHYISYFKKNDKDKKFDVNLEDYVALVMNIVESFHTVQFLDKERIPNYRNNLSPEEFANMLVEDVFSRINEIDLNKYNFTFKLVLSGNGAHVIGIVVKSECLYIVDSNYCVVGTKNMEVFKKILLNLLLFSKYAENFNKYSVSKFEEITRHLSLQKKVMEVHFKNYPDVFENSAILKFEALEGFKFDPPFIEDDKDNINDDKVTNEEYNYSVVTYYLNLFKNKFNNISLKINNKMDENFKKRRYVL